MGNFTYFGYGQPTEKEMRDALEKTETLINCLDEQEAFRRLYPALIEELRSFAKSLKNEIHYVEKEKLARWNSQAKG